MPACARITSKVGQVPTTAPRRRADHRAEASLRRQRQTLPQRPARLGLGTYAAVSAQLIQHVRTLPIDPDRSLTSWVRDHLVHDPGLAGRVLSASAVIASARPGCSLNNRGGTDPLFERVVGAEPGSRWVTAVDACPSRANRSTAGPGGPALKLAIGPCASSAVQ